MKEHNYTIRLSIDLCKAAPGVEKAVSPLQSILATYGMGKLAIRSKCLVVNIKSGRVLTRKERDIVKKILLEHLREAMPDYDVKIESMRRNSRKSSSQPNSRS